MTSRPAPPPSCFMFGGSLESEPPPPRRLNRVFSLRLKLRHISSRSGGPSLPPPRLPHCGSFSDIRIPGSAPNDTPAPPAPKLRPLGAAHPSNLADSPEMSSRLLPRSGPGADHPRRHPSLRLDERGEFYHIHRGRPLPARRCGRSKRKDRKST